jgi:hypothetical protein
VSTKERCEGKNRVGARDMRGSVVECGAMRGQWGGQWRMRPTCAGAALSALTLPSYNAQLYAGVSRASTAAWECGRYGVWPGWATRRLTRSAGRRCWGWCPAAPGNIGTQARLGPVALTPRCRPSSTATRGAVPAATPHGEPVVGKVDLRRVVAAGGAAGRTGLSLIKQAAAALRRGKVRPLVPCRPPPHQLCWAAGPPR